jgi:hypothetical protein
MADFNGLSQLPKELRDALSTEIQEPDTVQPEPIYVLGPIGTYQVVVDANNEPLVSPFDSGAPLGLSKLIVPAPGILIGASIVTRSSLVGGDLDLDIVISQPGTDIIVRLPNLQDVLSGSTQHYFSLGPDDVFVPSGVEELLIQAGEQIFANYDSSASLEWFNDPNPAPLSLWLWIQNTKT